MLKQPFKTLEGTGELNPSTGDTWSAMAEHEEDLW